MENYILKLYQREKQKYPEVEQGFDRFEPRVRWIVIGCFIGMIASCVEMIVTMLLFPKQLWYYIGAVALLIFMAIALGADNINQKKYIDKYVDSHKKKLKILGNILAKEFNIKDKNKVQELINIYQECVDRRIDRERKGKSIILKIGSAFIGILTFSFENMSVLGMSLNSWIYLATILFVFVVAIESLIYLYTFYNPLRIQYEMMIKDLKELLLIEFNKNINEIIIVKRKIFI